jgi:hypothetical protein
MLVQMNTKEPLGDGKTACLLCGKSPVYQRLVNLRHVLPVDPLGSMKKPSTKTDRKRIRRFLLPEEWKWIRQTPYFLKVTNEEGNTRNRRLSDLDPTQQITSKNLHKPNKIQ